MAHCASLIHQKPADTLARSFSLAPPLPCPSSPPQRKGIDNGLEEDDEVKPERLMLDGVEVILAPCKGQLHGAGV